MISFPFFDPARPPPLAAPSDEQLVDQFLKSRPECRTVARKPSVSTSSITEMKAKLCTVVSELDQLGSKKETLEKEIQSLPDSEWRTAIGQLSQMQQSIECKLSELSDPAASDQLKRKLLLRHKKRAWLKRRKARLQQEQADRMKNREKLDTAIDQWQEDQRKLLEEEKRTQQELDYASHFLADVHRRKAAAKRYLAKFEKIRNSMKHRDLGDDEGDKNLAKLTQTWSIKLTECIKEEKRLKDVLARRSAANYQRRVENEWNRTLFGDTIPKRFEHPLLEADRNREALIATRWAWDACLTSEVDEVCEGSAIPLGWVLPPKDALPEWAQYQVKELS